jgi:hypothetical protein
MLWLQSFHFCAHTCWVSVVHSWLHVESFGHSHSISNVTLLKGELELASSSSPVGPTVVWGLMGSLDTSHLRLKFGLTLITTVFLAYLTVCPYLASVWLRLLSPIALMNDNKIVLWLYTMSEADSKSKQVGRDCEQLGTFWLLVISY